MHRPDPLPARAAQLKGEGSGDETTSTNIKRGSGTDSRPGDDRGRETCYRGWAELKYPGNIRSRSRREGRSSRNGKRLYRTLTALTF